MKLVSIVIAVVFSFIGILGDSALKVSGSGPEYVKLRWFVAGFLVYALTAFGWFFAMKYIKLGTLGVIYAVSTVLFSVAVGIWWFRESYTMVELFAVGLACASILLLASHA